MEYKYLIIGTYNSQHVYNFIRVVLKDAEYGSICFFSDTGDKEPEPDIVDYYKERGVKLFIREKHTKKRNKVIDVISRYTELFIALKKVSVCKYTFVHFLSKQRAILSLMLPMKTRIIPVTYGSDILRNRKLDSFPFSVLFKRAYRIVFNLKNLRNVFESKYPGKYTEKCRDIPFATTSLRMVQDIENKVTREEALDQYRLPHDKLIVVCGHTATEAEQHCEMIDALCMCNDDSLKQCCIVFPMSYAPGDFIPYRNKVEMKLKDSGLDFRIIKDYLPYYDSLIIHIASDIHITAILTDALSFYLREELYTCSALIYGKWLNYYELEDSGMKVFPFDSLKELPAVLSNVVSWYPELKDELFKNKKKSIALMSEDGVHDKWKMVID